ncbi:hypothetical protein IWW38_006036 [Coemansia aciculifera]|uniref:Uncharacterized protein n=1 Tax=Coemansia aciculifera TaxID=417176 RepID=A0ACC1LUX5_9FUNG|nr:hypothetical protein IWW38_006036 [Coemansia aciculifera]
MSQMLRDLTMAQASKGKSKKSKKRRQRADMILDDDSGSVTPVASIDPVSIDEPERDSTPVPKRELRREKQKGKAATAGSNILKCNVCSEGFATRNQLFKHIGDTGHALASDHQQQQKTKTITKAKTSKRSGAT